ncbi:MAG: hypothetical protein ACLQIB_11875 [Isosphaeraceae bacterium]
MIHAVAICNMTRRTGEFRSVLSAPGAAVLPAANRQAIDLGASEGLSLRIVDAAGRSLWQGWAPFYPSTCWEESEDRTGLVDALLPDRPGAAALQLLDGDRVLANFTVCASPTVVTNIRAASSHVAASPNPVIVWDDEQAGGAAGPSGGSAPPVYSVQLSADDGSTWRTIGLGLRRPSVTVDRHLLQGLDEVKVRVTSSDGFHTAAREEKISVHDLLNRSRS